MTRAALHTPHSRLRMRVRKLDCVNVSLQRGFEYRRMVDFALSDRVALAQWATWCWWHIDSAFSGSALCLTPRGLISFFWFAVVRGAFNAEYFMIHFGAERHLSRTTLDVFRALSRRTARTRGSTNSN